MMLRSPSPSKTKAKKVLRWTWRRPKDRPKRPRSGYNIFYAEERKRILAERSMQKESIGFVNLTRSVAASWKDLNETRRAPYVQQAKLELKRYRIAIANWKEEKTRQAAAKEKTPFDSNASEDETSSPVQNRVDESLEDPLFSNPSLGSQKRHRSSGSRAKDVFSRRDNMSAFLAPDRLLSHVNTHIQRPKDRYTANNSLDANFQRSRCLTKFNRRGKLSLYAALAAKEATARKSYHAQKHLVDSHAVPLGSLHRLDSCMQTGCYPPVSSLFENRLFQQDHQLGEKGMPDTLPMCNFERSFRTLQHPSEGRITKKTPPGQFPMSSAKMALSKRKRYPSGTEEWLFDPLLEEAGFNVQDSQAQHPERVEKTKVHGAFFEPFLLENEEVDSDRRCSPISESSVNSLIAALDEGQRDVLYSTLRK